MCINTRGTTTTTVSWPFIQDYPGETVPEKSIHSLTPIPSSTIVISFLHLLWSTASSLFNLRAWVFLHNLSPSPHWSTSWSHTLVFVLVSKLKFRLWSQCTHYTQITVLWPSWILSGTTWVSWQQKGKYRKVKLIWIYWSKRVSGSGISWATCKYAPWPRHNHANIPPLNFLQAGCSSCHPTNSVKAFLSQYHNFNLSFDLDANR